jgi:hypothetical protein
MVMSKNWLTLWSEGKAVVPAAKAQLATRQDDFARKVEQFRKVTGKAETRRMSFICACTSGRFFAEFERLNPQEKFRMSRIEKEQGAASAGGLLSNGSHAEQILDGNDFDVSSWHCPYCQVRSGFVHCNSCGANVCGGRTTELADGKRRFRCRDGCNATGELVPYGKLHLDQSRPGLSPSAPWRSAAPLLPGGNTPLLGGPRR